MTIRPPSVQSLGSARDAVDETLCAANELVTYLHRLLMDKKSTKKEYSL
jgi:hypothetical protein